MGNGVASAFVARFKPIADIKGSINERRLRAAKPDVQTLISTHLKRTNFTPIGS